ncbi:hypothetical protein FIU88_08310 [Halomonas sp. THAF12]|uniref:hypothetical protein n=1 Tax=Halomonas sp. THAF12 TaxID=2587849 RepID=UPI001268803C|nr:hypothetical protein [Halomonas sp. THAF12]QFT84977.1 hypothetical protein FIU88_08310 [Halomonas sp. THAF12]
MISPTTRAISGIATRVDATTRLLQCTRSLLDEDHRPILDIAVRQLWLCTEGARFAARRIHGQPASPSADLITDVMATTGEGIHAMSPGDLLDSYVSLHLDATRGALLVVESLYLDSDEKPLQQIGVALFECLHWISSAREELQAYSGTALEAALAA